jgi:hypothetical protein
MQIAQIATRDAEAADLALIEELEQESLLLQGPEIAAVCALFTVHTSWQRI